METKLSNIEDYLRKVQLYQTQKAEEQKQTATETVKPVVPVEDKIVPPQVVTPVIPPVVNDKPPVIVPEIIVPPVVIIDKIIIDEAQEIRSELSVDEIMNTPVTPVQPIRPVQPVETQKSFYDKFRENNPDLEKFIGENILSKVAITILVIGIAFFVKYAIDKDWINEIARVGIGILCGGIVLGFAHRLRKNFKAFSSVLVAGGIAIFYFTIGIAFHEYHLFGQTTAFIFMLIITSFSVFISVMYDRQELAVLSLIGGFATPFMVSTGQGNYQVLFTYVLILDLGMLVLAYLRKWNLLNILAYAFTMILYWAWLQSKVIGEENGPYKGAMIFAAIFYVVFIVMSLIHNIKEKRKFGAIDITILVSNTFLFYGAGMQILNYYHPHLLGQPRNLQGFFSLFLAAFNLVCSWLLYKKFKADQKLVYLMIGLTLTFVTLVAPVQLHGNYITIFWAMESVLLIWLSQKSNIIMYRFASILIMVLMSFSLFIDWSQTYMIYHDLKPAVILNKGFITGIVCALSLMATALLLRKDTEKVSWAGMQFNPTAYASFLQIAFIVLLYFSGLFELLFQMKQVVYYGVSITIVAGAYHFLYFLLLNLVQEKTENQKTGMVLFVFNYVNAVVFVLIFAVLPYVDFKDNMMQPERSYLGFIAHYVSLLCFVSTLFFMRRWILKDAENKSGALNTVFVSVAIVYVSSLELILHVSQLVIGTVKTITDEELWAKAAELNNAETHIIKIGFPILWGLLAFVFLFIGMRKQNKSLRIMSLILIGVILLKLFTFDIKDASEAGKIVAFIILGVVLLIISFMYQKIKKLIIDDKPETDVSITNDPVTPPIDDKTDSV